MEVNNLVDWSSLSPQQQLGRLAQANNEWSAQQASQQMDFQERMSNTAHQREVADLKAAGLNPVLSAKLGGASTPTGAMGATDTSLTSALVDLLQLSMQTANSAAGAAYSVSQKSSGNGLFGLPEIKNPRQPWQLFWNWVTQDPETVEFYEEAAKDIGSGITKLFSPSAADAAEASDWLQHLTDPTYGYKGRHQKGEDPKNDWVITPAGSKPWTKEKK